MDERAGRKSLRWVMEARPVTGYEVNVRMTVTAGQLHRPAGDADGWLHTAQTSIRSESKEENDWPLYRLIPEMK